jgi:hypothetical protein
MDEIDKKQQQEIDAATHHNRLQDAKDREHDYKFARYAFLFAVFFGWLTVLSLACFVSLGLESKITVTVEPKR